MRKPSKSDFLVPVEDIGTFTFATRTMGDEIAIQREYARMLDGVPATEWLSLVCGWIAALKMLTVSAPEGWDLDGLDPLDPESYAKMQAVHGALRAKEASFRRGKAATGEGGGPGAVA